MATPILLRDPIRAAELRWKWSRKPIRCDGCGGCIPEGGFYATVDRLVSAGRRCRTCATALVGSRGEAV